MGLTNDGIGRHQHNYTVTKADGCVVYPVCLSCPLAVCVFDDAKGVSVATGIGLASLYSDQEILDRVTVSKRTLYRWRQLAREETHKLIPMTDKIYKV